MKEKAGFIRLCRSVLLLVTVFLAVPVIAQPPQARIHFIEAEYDFGTFKEETGPRTHMFAFENRGKAPLILQAVYASCGCTTPQWTQKPVAPGGQGVIRVSYNPEGRPGPFRKAITVSTNGDPARTVLTIKGVVEPRPKTLAEQFPRKVGPIRVRSNHLNFSTLRQNEVVTDTLAFVSDTDKPVSLSFRNTPEHLKVRVEPSRPEPGEKGNIIVTYDARKVNSYGFVIHRLYLEVDGRSDYRNSIGVTATIEEDFSGLSPEELATAPVASFNTLNHDFGAMREGDREEFSFVLHNEGKRDLIIREVKASCGCTVVTPARKLVPAGESAALKVVFDTSGKFGRQNKAITVITNDPHKPTSILRVAATVRTR
ncbi:MAG: DUF1573 domain-containing protein [Mangrovibacterium sp.]